MTTDPVLDAARLAEIADLDLFSPTVREHLDRFAAAAATRFDVPIGLVTIVLDTTQYFAGMHGLEGWLAETYGTPVEWSFCASAVRSGEPYTVEDATLSPEQHDNPLVTVDGIRCYAGVPLVTGRGFVIGTLCVIDSSARHFSEEDLAALRSMADEVVERIELGRVSTRAA